MRPCRRCAHDTGAIGSDAAARRAAANDRVPSIALHLASLRRAKDLIDRDFAEQIDLDAMAREAGYSEETDDMKKTFAGLKAKGVTLVMEPAERP